MTKREALEFIKAERDPLEYANQLAGKRVIDFAIAIADYLLADDEPAKVETSLRGWAMVNETLPVYARWDGLYQTRTTTIRMWAWDGFGASGQTIRKMTPADLEVTE